MKSKFNITDIRKLTFKLSRNSSMQPFDLPTVQQSNNSTNQKFNKLTNQQLYKHKFGKLYLYEILKLIFILIIIIKNGERSRQADILHSIWC